MPIKLAAKPFGFTFDRGFGWSDRISGIDQLPSLLGRQPSVLGLEVRVTSYKNPWDCENRVSY